MAEGAVAFGIVTGVIGLLPLCANGCSFIENICKADRRLEEHMDLDAWGHTWEIPSMVPERKKDFKLQRWIERNQDRGFQILGALSVISNVFADTHDLEAKYGIQLKKKHPALRETTVEAILGDRRNIDQIQMRVESRRQHMSILKRCHFELKGTVKFNTLIERLREFISTLVIYVLKPRQINEDPGSLAIVSRVYGEEAKRRRNAGQEAQGAELISEIAAFKARIQRLARKRHAYLEERRRSDVQTPFLLMGKFLEGKAFEYELDLGESENKKISLAMDKGARKARYLEWKPYAYSDKILEPDRTGILISKTRRIVDKKTEDDVMALSDFLSVEDRPKAFRVLPFLGIFRDELQCRFGFVYRPPQYIENLEGENHIEGQVGKLRMPKSLLDILEKDSQAWRPSICPLGDRFQLARTLAQCLYVLHAAGWVHKNIRSSSIVFLPHESGYGGIPSTSGNKDMQHPYLCGFGHSKPGQDLELNRHREPREQAPTYDDGYGRVETERRWNITLDEYHHPAKRADSSVRYTQGFDLYSLGIVLLEIGLWQPLSTLHTTDYAHDPPTLRRRLLIIARDELPGQVGKIYANVVRECLNVERNDTDMKIQHVLCWKVAAALDDCRA